MSWIERRQQPIDIGLKALCESVLCASASDVCAAVMNQLMTSASSGDDVTLLVLSR